MKKDVSHGTNRFSWLEYIAVSIIVIAFFVISYCGFYVRDDLSMAYGGVPVGFGERIIEISSILDVFKLTWWWYFHLGGRVFSVAVQYMFTGLLGNKLWFDIVNTLFFLLFVLTCGKLINGSKTKLGFCVLLFALLFWFFCPIPCETLFWVAGSTTYLWANTLAFVFLLFFHKYKDDNFGVVGKLALFIMSFFAATEYITCPSICGAFVVYYAFHIKKFKGNAVPFVLGYALGSILVLFAPGDFLRASWYYDTSLFYRLKKLVFNPFQEIIKYKVLWMFLFVLVLGWIKNRMVTKAWIRNNAILLLSLGWSVIACSFVFMVPVKRATFFTESLSLVLLLKFLFDNYGIIKSWFIHKFPVRNLSIFKNAVVILLFAIFIMDSAFAVVETKRQSDINDAFLNEIKETRGFVASQEITSSHRMAHLSRFPDWTVKPLAEKYGIEGMDSIHSYPFYCLDKYYNQGFPIDNVYIVDRRFSIKDAFANDIRMIVRIEEEKLPESNNHVVFTIDYTRPRKWYKTWLDKRRNYQYDRTVVVEANEPSLCFRGYCYYIIWLKRENAKNLKSVKYEFK